MADVTMLVPVSGVRNAVPWPGVGGVASVPRAEAESLIAAGIAEATVQATQLPAGLDDEEDEGPQVELEGKPAKPDKGKAEVETATRDADTETPEKKPARATKAAAAKKAKS